MFAHRLPICDLSLNISLQCVYTHMYIYTPCLCSFDRQKSEMIDLGMQKFIYFWQKNSQILLFVILNIGHYSKQYKVNVINNQNLLFQVVGYRSKSY